MFDDILYFAILFEAEMKQFLSEKIEARESVTEVTMTSDEDFAAKNLLIYDRKGIAR